MTKKIDARKHLEECLTKRLKEKFHRYGKKKVSATFEVENAPYCNISGRDSMATITLLTTTPPYDREKQPKFHVSVREMEVIAHDMLAYVAEAKRVFLEDRLD